MVAHHARLGPPALIEVANTTLRLDRGVKIPLYARAGVREVWLVDLTTARLEVCREAYLVG
jgi:Uma2 family endonuclease